MHSDLDLVAAETCNSLPFVTWDRFMWDGEWEATVFGWIARNDGQRDFVVLTFGEHRSVGFTTSSAKHAAAIAKALYGSADEHNPCRRIEDESHAINSVVHIERTAQLFELDEKREQRA